MVNAAVYITAGKPDPIVNPVCLVDVLKKTTDFALGGMLHGIVEYL